MSTNRSKWAISFVLVLAFCTSLYAQKGQWTYLGDAHVDGMQDHDSIKVGRAAGAYRAIQLRISGGAINFERVIVRYGNGTQEEISIRSRIPDGGQTRVIDLPGERRMIRSVDLWVRQGQVEPAPQSQPIRSALICSQAAGQIGRRHKSGAPDLDQLN